MSKVAAEIASVVAQARKLAAHGVRKGRKKLDVCVMEPRIDRNDAGKLVLLKGADQLRGSWALRIGYAVEDATYEGTVQAVTDERASVAVTRSDGLNTVHVYLKPADFADYARVRAGARVRCDIRTDANGVARVFAVVLDDRPASDLDEDLLYIERQIALLASLQDD